MNLEIEKGELSDEDAAGVPGAPAKQGRESVSGFERGWRRAPADREREEPAIINRAGFPGSCSEEEIDKAGLEASREAGASSPGDTGRVMKIQMPGV